MGVVVLGKIETKSDLAECLKIVRAGAPRWCGRHEDFESVANEVIGFALATYDPTRGRFSDRLITRSQSRVCRMLVRSSPTRRLVLVSLPEADERGEGVLATGPATDPGVIAPESADIAAFFESLCDQLRPVAELLLIGLSQAEVAAELALHPRQVSRLVARLQPLAASFFNRPDLLSA